ncbi:hypothetical protein ACJ7VE_34150 [Streptomyces sp. PB17]|uniref:RapZ C-terminal domain-containing protein n=1 Tax=Streptomyces sp. PB17 TaxID=3384158 RepID=UPI0038B666F6
MRPIRLTSFGYLHLPTSPDGSPVPPAADRIEDVRDRLRDPAAARDILDLDGLNPAVQDVVLATPGARELLANLADYADLPAGPSRIAIGCAGGRHRASGLTELLARELRDRGREVVVEHLHVHLPRVLKKCCDTSMRPARLSFDDCQEALPHPPCCRSGSSAEGRKRGGPTAGRQ